MEHRENETGAWYDVERNEFGVDVSALRRKLKLTPAQRLAQYDKALANVHWLEWAAKWSLRIPLELLSSAATAVTVDKLVLPPIFKAGFRDDFCGDLRAVWMEPVIGHENRLVTEKNTDVPAFLNKFFVTKFSQPLLIFGRERNAKLPRSEFEWTENAAGRCSFNSGTVKPFCSVTVPTIA